MPRSTCRCWLRVEVMVANPNRILSWRMRREAGSGEGLPGSQALTQGRRTSPPCASVGKELPGLSRPVGLASAHATPLLAAIACFFGFSFTASATDLVNDMLDAESYRHHATKRLRPFAAGELPVARALPSPGCWQSLLLPFCLSFPWPLPCGWAAMLWPRQLTLFT